MRRPEGHAFQQAMRWIASEMNNNPDASRKELITQASLRFDLNPLEEQFLRNTKAQHLVSDEEE